MKTMKISGKIGVWISQFLHGRKQFVVANGVKSEEIDVISGTVQGSILGPILFIIALNSIYNVISNSSAGSYCDDTKVKKKSRMKMTQKIYRQT